jgi:hypothetical protein
MSDPASPRGGRMYDPIPPQEGRGRTPLKKQLITCFSDCKSAKERFLSE